MTYTPQPGTTAYRILAWLEAEGKTAERNSSQIANAMGIETNGVPTLLAPALAAHLVFRRQKDRTHPRAPFWYSLTNHGVRQREFTPKPVGWMQRPGSSDVSAGPRASDGAASNGKAVTPGPSQPEAAPDTPQGDQAGSEPAREVMEPEACESAAGRGTTGAPALATLPLHASPGVGPMGAGQPADAGPTTDVPVFITEQRREVDAQFAASLRAAMGQGDQLQPADLAATRRAVHAPHEPAPLAFRAARFTDGSLATERDGIVVAVYSAAEVDAIQKLLGVRG